MRYIMYGITCFVVTVLFLQMIVSMDARHARADELNQGVRMAVKTTLEAVREQKLKTAKDVESYFEQRMREQITSASDYRVEFLENKVEEGILSVKVEETFRYPNGKIGKIKEKQTAIIDYAVGEETP
ncbi:hypothetical protein SAMN02910358_01692 [Lachnospiraceae bacterium XBB1006]|nr:hypothetical protein SAMN02910358_01692 [Lachnospiraceae bacterium XBB1006]